ncbi:CDP-alcohol phosphatidyltransferase family protein [Gemmata sp. G18]|uniref:CDP-alcohol phosphatidyltransferase family protein n=1 Tax=Gemmata palustris TaxID=2822762 RepID=A0ABS5BX72_9BACT|nr:CDP-alcohol phosphatidyltransferase family protein [Gemmata palustris]MBP3958301.1 CDP-alcohol phosphatidyltransferase family protein [Gemmata palustris]
MFDARLRRLIDDPLDRLAAVMARCGLSANVVTVTGFAFGAAACAALAFCQYEAALALIALNRVADGLDGALARRLGPTDLGGYLDIALDFLFYSGVPFFFAVGRPEFALPACFLVFSFVGTGSSFLAFSAFAAKRGITTEARGKKAIYYLGGLTEGAETIAVFVLVCLFPDLFAWFAWIFGGMCWLTTATRLATAVETFRVTK